MAIDQHASNLIDLTVKTFNGNVTNVSPLDGMSLLDSWISFLETDEQDNSALSAGLSNLKAIIQEGGNIDSAEVVGILGDLTTQTKQISNTVETENKPELNSLVDALQSFSHLVDGSGGPARTGGQAPMTSTVGGESTNSGVGASALSDTDDDDLSDRNGGTVDEDSTIDMDDTTGSDGGAPEANAPEKPTTRSSAQTGDSGYSSGSGTSRSDTSRVDGPGLSGGTGDSDTAQSGGRSQY